MLRLSDCTVERKRRRSDFEEALSPPPPPPPPPCARAFKRLSSTRGTVSATFLACGRALRQFRRKRNREFCKRSTVVKSRRQAGSPPPPPFDRPHDSSSVPSLGTRFRILCRDLLARHKDPPPSARRGRRRLNHPLAATKVAPERFLLEERFDFGVRDRVLRRVGNVFLRDVPGRAVLDDLFCRTKRGGVSESARSFFQGATTEASRGESIAGSLRRGRTVGASRRVTYRLAFVGSLYVYEGLSGSSSISEATLPRDTRDTYTARRLRSGSRTRA